MKSMTPILALTLTIPLTSCGVGSFVARDILHQRDRVCFKEFPPAYATQLQPMVDAMFSAWAIPEKPQVVSALCDVVIDLLPKSIGTAAISMQQFDTRALFVQDTGDQIAGEYDPGGFLQGDPTLRISPAGVNLQGQLVYSQGTIYHEFGHSQKVTFPTNPKDLPHNPDETSIMHFRKFFGQTLTSLDQQRMAAARMGE